MIRSSDKQCLEEVFRRKPTIGGPSGKCPSLLSSDLNLMATNDLGGKSQIVDVAHPVAHHRRTYCVLHNVVGSTTAVNRHIHVQDDDDIAEVVGREAAVPSQSSPSSRL